MGPSIGGRASRVGRQQTAPSNATHRRLDSSSPPPTTPDPKRHTPPARPRSSVNPRQSTLASAVRKLTLMGEAENRWDASSNTPSKNEERRMKQKCDRIARQYEKDGRCSSVPKGTFVMQTTISELDPITG